ncbi:Interferon-related developmental regulator 1-like protein [Thalictrum thalictroides]|uniref:Interferon-related developmental regulator 1-like protein n=1 Tax=Thalictrum thalictroides TaxID=46969 RepID=A0A7J6UZY7_THATH|nr:Interferon-related developmental regulator 1-like protein [Thalictrum thalictroides]
MLDSLAVITFVGGNGLEDTERSMEIIWRFLHEELTTKPNTQVIISAISAWSFLLASIQTWSISSKLWKGSILYLTNLLEESDQSVLRIVAAETLAHIAEINAIEKFSMDAKDLNDGNLLTSQGDGGSIHEQQIRKLKDKIKGAMVETTRNNSSGKKELKSHRSLSTDVVAYLKTGERPETSVLIGQDELPISNWSQLIQVDYMQRFLGSSFVRHVMQNELFKDFYDFTPRAQAPHQPELYESSKEEESAGIQYVFQPEVSIKDPLYFRLYISENSVLNKRKTQLMKKQQALSASKNTGYFSVSFGDDEG